MLLEPIQGEGGIISSSDDYMKDFWNLVQGEENTLHRQGKNTL